MTIQRAPAVANPPVDVPRILPHLIYDDPGAAIEWLTRVFGFRERSAARHTSSDGSVERAQIEIGDSLITIGLPSIHGQSPRNGVSSMLYVYVENVDDHYRHAKAADATIVAALEDRLWGDRSYQAADHEGHQWSFAQHLRDVPLESCSS